MKNLKSLLQNEVTLTISKWIGSIFSIVAATGMAVFGHDYIELQLLWFVLYCIGSVLWGYVSIVKQDRAMLLMQAYFTILNIYGVWVRL